MQVPFTRTVGERELRLEDVTIDELEMYAHRWGAQKLSKLAVSGWPYFLI